MLLLLLVVVLAGVVATLAAAAHERGDGAKVKRTEGRGSRLRGVVKLLIYR